MNTLDFFDIALQWHGTTPVDLAHVEQIVFDKLHTDVLPMKPSDLDTLFISIPPGLVVVCGQEGSDLFHCVYLN
jgi:hypothetical protein